MSIGDIQNLRGYALVKALNEDSQECANPLRAELLAQAAREIAALVEELKKANREQRGV